MSFNIMSAFRNLRVGAKLGVGFGIVLLLTALITFVASSALHGVTDRVGKADDVNRMVKFLLEARQQEKNFVIRGEQKYADGVKEKVDSLIAQGKETKDRFADQYNKDEMDKVITAVNAYYAAFIGYVDTTRQRDTTAQAMEESARTVQTLMNKVRGEQKTEAMQLIRSGASAERLEDKIAKADDANRMLKWMLEIRRNEKNYMLRDDEKYVTSNDQLLSEMKSLMRALKSRYTNPNHQEMADKVMAALVDYSRNFNQYVEENKTAGIEMVNMLDNARAALDIAATTRKDQKAKLEAEIAAADTQLLTFSAIAVLLGIIAAYFITRIIVGPLTASVTTLNRLADGDLTVEVESHSKDEIGQLMSAMKHMATSLREIMTNIMGGTNQLATAAEELAAVTEDTSSGVNELMAETEQVATAMNEMSATVSEVSSNASLAASSTEEGRKVAADGRAIVMQTIDAINTLADNVTRSTEVINNLKQESNNIGTVLDVISGIAEQTNLLALNAAIEAARAGEQGRGFAVVADEVRTLAQRTQQSTDEIQSMITSLQNGANEAVGVMNTSQEQTHHTVAQAGQAGQALDEIMHLVEQIADMTTQIASAAEEQSATSGAVSESMNNISQVTERSAAGANQLAASSSELAQLGEHLRDQVARFKV